MGNRKMALTKTFYGYLQIDIDDQGNTEYTYMAVDQSAGAHYGTSEFESMQRYKDIPEKMEINADGKIFKLVEFTITAAMVEPEQFDVRMIRSIREKLSPAEREVFDRALLNKNHNS